MSEKKTANMARYRKIYDAKKKEAQRSLIQEQNMNKWKSHMLNVEYMQWVINVKKTNPVKAV
jgi:hypothetical protein